MKFIKDKSKIPNGPYCYTPKRFPCKENNWIYEIDICPYWSINKTKPSQNNGYCQYMEEGDWEHDGLGLLWDQCKECDIDWDDEWKDE